MKGRRPAWLLAAAVFAFMWVRPVYTVHLRHQLRQQLPEFWQHWPSNGPFAFLLPQMAGNLYHDGALYAAAVHQIALHGLPVSPYFAGHSEFSSWSHDFISYYLIAGAGLLCGSNITLTWLMAQALSATLWFLLLHAIFLRWSGKESVAAPLALFSVLFPDLYIWLLDINFSPSVTWDRAAMIFAQNFKIPIRPIFYRLPTPFLSFLLLAWLFVGLWALAKRKEPRTGAAAMLGAGFGLMAFVHPFEFLFGMMTVTIFAALVWRLKAPGRKNVLAAAIAAVLTTGAYFLLMFAVTDARLRRESMVILDLLYSHRFYKISIVHLAMAGVAWRWQDREKDWPKRLAWLLLICAQLAAFAGRNSQVITGLQLEPARYMHLGSFFGCLMLFMKLAELLAAKRWWNPKMAGATCLVIALGALYNEKSAAEHTYKALGLPRDTADGLEWVRQNAPEDAVFMSPSMITVMELPIYTQVKAFVPSLGALPTVLYSYDDYLRWTAQMLKTVGADVDKFLALRWPLPAEKARIFNDESWRQRLLGQADEGALDGLEWSVPVPHDADFNDEANLKARAKIKEFYSQAAPAEGPYFVWINARDIPLLREFPPLPNAELVYRNSSVWIFKSAMR
jgi:hypothetical protein